MKVVILAGGLGSRLSKYTNRVPKPMVKINNTPIIEHIMSIYKKYGFNDFIIAAGYKQEVIKKYFKNNSQYKVEVVDTGKETLTGGRILRLKKILNNKTFMLTYGDGLADINLKKLLEFHKKNKKMVTITAVRPPSSFGVMEIKKNLVKNFKEKIQMTQGWINGGFFVIEPRFIKFIRNDYTILERDPLEKASSANELVAYKHKKFWHCMDTIKDKEGLEKLIQQNNAPWL